MKMNSAFQKKVLAAALRKLKKQVRVNRTTGCWLRKAGGSSGSLIIAEDRITSRTFFEAFKRELKAGEYIQRKCNYPHCHNPDHMRVVNYRGGNTRGSKNGFSKMVEEDIREMLELYAGGWSQADIAREFEVNPQYVCRVVNGRAWKHVALDESEDYEEL